jgi:hypothetical protein
MLEHLAIQRERERNIVPSLQNALRMECCKSWILLDTVIYRSCLVIKSQSYVILYWTATPTPRSVGGDFFFAITVT